MAQVFAFGRAGLSTASGGDGLELHCVDWQWRGDTARVKIIVRKQSSLADAKALVAQVLGYDLNTDEPVIPVTWSEDSSVDGFWRVQSVEADAELTGRLGSPTEAGGNVAWTLTAELLRVPGWQAPTFEVVTSGAVRSNAHAITTGADPWVAIPGSAVALDYSHAGSENTATTATGTVMWFTDSASSLYDGSLRYSVAPSAYYQAGCQIEWTPNSGTTWRSLTGRQINNDPDGWRINNGRVRVSIVSTDVLRVEWYDSGSWEATDFEIYSATSPQWTPNTVTVLRNSPETVAVRVHLTHGTARGTYWDLTLHRGATWVEGRAVSVDTVAWGLYRSASEDGTAITGGLEATAVNGSGNKYVMLTPVAKTNDLTGVSGFDVNSSATSLKFAASAVNVGVDGSSATSTHYFAAMNFVQSITAR